jgi:sec-independent protein translocase protein TatB
MFDIGFSELIVIGLVALVVVGPQRLPVATRTIGTLLGRAQRYVNDVKSDIQRQVDLEELRKVQEQVKTMGEEIQSTVQNVEQEVGSVTASVSDSVNASWDGFESDDASTTTSLTRRGWNINSPEPSWSDLMEQRRVRDKLRNRMRKRFMQKRVHDET